MRLAATSFVRPPSHGILATICAVMAIAVTAGCSGSRETSAPESSPVTVEGIVSVRGNEPFTGLMLVTADRNSYILVLADREERSELQRRAPGRFLVTGVPYKDVWQGRHFAHLRVIQWERIDT